MTAEMKGFLHGLRTAAAVAGALESSATEVERLAVAQGSGS